VQLAAPDGLNLPEGQVVQTEAPDVLLNVPGLQIVHDELDSIVAPVGPYDPESHCCPVHTVVPKEPVNVPAGHGEHVLLPWMPEKNPGLHGEHRAASLLVDPGTP